MECFVCRDGTLLTRNDVCSECGQEAKITREFVEDSVLNSINIPEIYKNIIWAEEELFKTHPENMDNEVFKKYARNLTKIINSFDSEKPFDQSLMLFSEKGTGKTTFIYCLQKKILENGFSTLPLIDTDELSKILNFSTDKALLNISLKDLLEVDYLFINVSKTTNRFSAYEPLEDIYDKRARYGLSTITISDFALEELSRWDKYGRLSRMVTNAAKERDIYRYPLFIGFFNYRR